MADRPIIFSAPMVRALLDGRKTQTRRVLGNSGPGRGRSNIFSAQIGWSDSYVLDPGNANWRERDTPYAPGDRLWVREAFYLTDDGEAEAVVYAEDEGGLAEHREAIRQMQADLRLSDAWAAPHLRLRSPIHMPRWASRLTMTVTDVRVQRVQEISEDDARAEGVLPDGFEGYRGHEGTIGYPTAIWAFRHIWNSIHGPDAWDANPWVAAISFTVHRCNIDTMEEGTW